MANRSGRGGGNSTSVKAQYWIRQLRNSAVLAAASSIVSALFTFAQARSLSIDTASLSDTNPVTLIGLFVNGLYSVSSLWFTVSLMGFGFRGAQLVRSHGVQLRMRPGWAIGGWFIPIAQLIIPFVVLSDVAGVGASGDVEAAARKRSLGWFWLWWSALSQIASYALGEVFSTNMVTQFGGWKVYAGVLAFNIVPLMMARKVFAQIGQDLERLPRNPETTDGAETNTGW